jgi:hypothetical protein
MVAFLDFSFDKALSEKDKAFMVAYREHIRQVQKEINKLKSESNESKYLALKMIKIQQFEEKLAKIRQSAMFLSEMSE